MTQSSLACNFRNWSFDLTQVSFWLSETESRKHRRLAHFTQNFYDKCLHAERDKWFAFCLWPHIKLMFRNINHFAIVYLVSRALRWSRRSVKLYNPHQKWNQEQFLFFLSWVRRKTDWKQLNIGHSAYGFLLAAFPSQLHSLCVRIINVYRIISFAFNECNKNGTEGLKIDTSSNSLELKANNVCALSPHMKFQSMRAPEHFY